MHQVAPYTCMHPYLRARSFSVAGRSDMAETTHVAFFFFAVVLVISAVLAKLKNRSAAKVNLPPGPWNLPVIGSLHCLLGSLPHRAMRRLAGQHGPVMLLRLGHVRMLVLSSPEAAREATKAHDAAFAARPLNPTTAVVTYGGQGVAFSPHWRELRKVCTLALFTPRRVRAFRPVREAEAARLVRSVRASPSWPLVNLSDHVAAMMNDVTMRTAVGGRCRQQEEYLRELHRATELVAGFSLVDLFPGSRLACALSAGSLRVIRACHERIHRVMEAMIQDQLRAMEEDGGAVAGVEKEEESLLGALLRLQRDGGLGIDLTTEIISAVLFDILAGGSDTTSITVIWAMSELMRNPHAMQRAQHEVRQAMHGRSKVTEADIEGSTLHYMEMVIKETLRLHPPFPLLLPRLCTEPCKIMGFDVPQGTTVVTNAWAIGRNEQSWDDPEAFRPERFEDDNNYYFNGTTDFRFLPGGSGRRMCPGLMFAHRNVELALASLLYHFDWKLPNGARPDELDMSESSGITASRRTDLWIEAASVATI